MEIYLYSSNVSEEVQINDTEIVVDNVYLFSESDEVVIGNEQNIQSATITQINGNTLTISPQMSFGFSEGAVIKKTDTVEGFYGTTLRYGTCYIGVYSSADVYYALKVLNSSVFVSNNKKHLLSAGETEILKLTYNFTHIYPCTTKILMELITDTKKTLNYNIVNENYEILNNVIYSETDLYDALKFLVLHLDYLDELESKLV